MIHANIFYMNELISIQRFHLSMANNLTSILSIFQKLKMILISHDQLPFDAFQAERISLHGTLPKRLNNVPRKTVPAPSHKFSARLGIRNY